MSDYFLEGIWSLKDLPIVKDLRGIGMMAAIEVFPMEGKPGIRGNDMQKKLFWNGCHVKWTGDNAIVAPSLIAEKSHIDEIIESFHATLKDV